MPVDTVTLFFALLSGLAVVIALAVVGSALVGDRFGVIAGLRPVALEVAAAVAVIATAGSLYLSEVAGYDPCRLCWVQRGFMYPSALLLVGSLALRPRSAHRLAALAALGLSAIGLAVAVFHRWEQAYGGVGDFCEQTNPCSLRWVEHFGFVTVPTMAAAGFVAVVTLIPVALSPLRTTAMDERS